MDVRDAAHLLSDAKRLLGGGKLGGGGLVIHTAGGDAAQAHAPGPRLAAATGHGARLVDHLSLHSQDTRR